MAKEKEVKIEREYIIPLRREIMKVPRYKRTPKAIKAIKQFIAKHMKVPERDLKKVKMSKWLNQEMWFRGIQNPLTKIKVKAVKEGEIVRVELAEIPDHIKYAMAREEKAKQEGDKVKAKKKEEVKEEKPSEEVKTEEHEKEEAVKEAEEKVAKSEAKEQKHALKEKHIKTERIQRKTLPKKD